jgi:phosphoribosylformylglycinamidine synthase
MDLKRAGDRIYLAGATRREFGGSLFNRIHQRNGGAVPAPVPDAVATMRALHRAIRNDHVHAMHDLSEGGLGVAAAEMCIAGRLGMALSLSDVTRAPDADSDAALLFAESAGRFLIEVAPEHQAAFEATVDGLPIACVGTVTPTAELKIQGLKEAPILTATVAALRTAWQSADIV